MAGPQPPGTPPTTTPERFPPDTLLDGRYHVACVLGVGGFGRVYRAMDTRLEREVAIKELLADRQQDRATYAQYLERFQREARAGSALRSAHVVTVYDLHVDAARNYYLVMEYVEGQDLSDLLAQVGVLPWERALAIARDISHALDTIHEHDIVHRDVKPANILITLRGVAKLTDFGLAQVAHESQRSQIATRHPGTPLYMSPEQRVGYGYIDGRSDLYSLGLVLHEMLAGQRFSETGQPLRSVRPDLPTAIIAIVEKLLQEDRDDRYPSARALRDDLICIIAQPDTPATALPGLRAASVPVPPLDTPPPVPAAPPPAPARGAPGGRRAALIAGGVALCLLLLAAFLVSRSGRRGDAAAPAPAASTASVSVTPSPTERGESLPAPTRATPSVVGDAPADTTPVAASATQPAATLPPATSAVRPLVGSPTAASTTAALPAASGGSARPLTEPTRTDTDRRAESAAGGTPAAGRVWRDGRGLVQLAVPRGWQLGSEGATPGNTLVATGPEGTSFSLEIYDTPEGTLTEAIANRRRNPAQNAEYRSTDAAEADTTIADAAAKTLSFTYAPRAPTGPARAGQIWIVIHGGKEYVFTALDIGQNRSQVNAIITSVQFLR